MNDMSNPPKPGTKLDGLGIISNFTSQASNTPQPIKPEGPLTLGRNIPTHGYYKDPRTGQEFSGGMEIAPTHLNR